MKGKALMKHDMQKNNRNLCHTSQPHQTEISGHSEQPDGPKPRRDSMGMEK